MEALRKRAVASHWSDEKAFLPLTNPLYRTKSGAQVVLEASLETVEHVLSSALRPDRALVKAVAYESGRIVQILDTSETPHDALDKELDTMAAEIVKRDDAPLAKVDQPKAATTVATPSVGCPMPDFPEVDARASRVLEMFLSPAQTEDYRKRGAFVCVGADTGANYLICNREGPALMKEQARQMMAQSFRQIFNLDERRAICVHDWTVPPPEEMLALKLCLTLPGLERAMLALPEVYE